MPPPPGTYNASFTVNGVAYGFDVQQNSYQENTSANLTIRTIPWSQVYTVIVQGLPSSAGANIGSKATTRTYKAVVYSETDYLNIRGQRGQSGVLLTLRETGSGTGYQAVLTDIKRGDKQDTTTPTGPQTIELAFTMLQ